MTDDQLVQLVAQVLAWQDGGIEEECRAAATTATLLDYAQQCMEDLRDWGIWSTP